MPRTRGTTASFVAPFVAFALAVAACGSSANSGPVAAPTVESAGTVLLPAPTSPAVSAEPTVTVAGDVAQSATPATAPPGPAYGCLGQRERFSQLLMALGTQADLPTAQALAAAGELGAFGFLGSPDENVGELIAQVQFASEVPVMFASDEEGGLVQRFGASLGRIESARALAASRSPAEVEAIWADYGARLAALGVDTVLAPVADVGFGPAIESRSFSDDPAVVTEYVGAVVAGLQRAGIRPVLKHFPGHGRASGDSHLGLPTAPSVDELRSVDLVPYRALVGDHAGDDLGVMIAHLVVPGLAEDEPTSLSYATISELLRSEIGFGGLVFSDALNMGAITNSYGVEDAALTALLVGTDIVILGSTGDVGSVLDHLVDAATSDGPTADVLEFRAARVLDAKGLAGHCGGAQ